MRNVTFMRYELADLLPVYEMIRDCISGEKAVKKAGVKYLPHPSTGVSEKSLTQGELASYNERYKAYSTRAVFYNACRPTIGGMIGQIFAKPYHIKTPPLLDATLQNPSGVGLTFEQIARKAVLMNLAYSRFGVFVDFPAMERSATLAELQNGTVKPSINVYAPWQIVNWRTDYAAGQEILTLVVIFEKYTFEDDGFEFKNAGQFIALRLENGVYVREVWREKNPTAIKLQSDYNKSGIFELYETSTPLDANGLPMTRIPFVFCGTENNDANPDNPNFADLATINIAHFRDSAEYEDSCFMIGQPTPVFTGLTKEWIDEVLKGQIQMGAGGNVLLPENGSATLLQAAPNTLAFEAMEHKEKLMIALGAKLIEQKTVQRTATEALIDSSSQTSILKNVAQNTSAALKWALQKAAELIGENANSVEFALNDDFDIVKMSPDERRALIESWQKGAISFEEMRDEFRRDGIATADDAQVMLQAEAMRKAQQMATNAPQNVGN